MNLNPVKWSEAQGLLVELIHALTPLTVRTVPASLFLSRRFYALQDDFQTFPMRPVRLLTTLHLVQQQVDKLLEEAEHQESHEEGESEKEELTPLDNNRSTFSKEAPPLSQQAQKLIDQVQNAIGELASSANIQEPQEAPLRYALKKLKPQLDRLIEAVSHNPEKALEPDRQTYPHSFRHVIPRSAREEIIQRFSSFPQTESRSKQPVALPEQEVVIAAPARATPQIPREVEKEAQREAPMAAAAPLPKKESAPPIIPVQQKKIPSKRGGEEFLPEKREFKENSVESKPQPLDGLAEKAPEGQKAPKPLDLIALPGAPFLSEIKRPTLIRKKKKRKGFWFKDDKDNSEEQNES